MQRTKKAYVETQELQDQRTVGSRHQRWFQEAVGAGSGHSPLSNGSGHLAAHGLITYNLYLLEGAGMHTEL